MNKKIAVALLILTLSTNTVTASSLHGDFEGNPIVKIISNGHELKIEDVPAINYKDRTLVPIYLLNQIGASVSWDAANYGANVIINSDNSFAEESIVKDTLQWLSDTNNAIWMFAIRFQQCTNIENPSDYLQSIDADFVDLINQNNESMTFAQKINEKIKISSSAHFNEIINSQSKTMEQLYQTKNLFRVWINSSNDPRILSSFQLSLHNSLQMAQKNISSTNKVVHDIAKVFAEKKLTLTR